MLFGLFGRRKAPSPARLADLEQRLDDVDIAITWLRRAMKDLNARISGVMRRVERDESREDAPGDTNAGGEPPHLPPAPSAHLASRFRGF